MTELATIDNETLLDVCTGELLPATILNAATVLNAARTMKQRLNDVVHDATQFLQRESQTRGTKTLETGREKIVLTGGPTVDYDPTDLQILLREAGCPEGRIEEAVVPEITWKVNRSVLRQLAGANPEYGAAIRAAERVIEKPVRASVKP